MTEHSFSMQFDLDHTIKQINSQATRMEGLNNIQNALAQGLTSASFLGQLDKLFNGLRLSLSQQSDTNSLGVEIILKCNQILLDMIGDVQHSDDLEIQYAQLIPFFIENLGSSKPTIRKSTHKCIATYVKLTKKLEFVLLHINTVGLDNTNTRTRQHSMLVIPALFSLKSNCLEKGSQEIVDLVSKVLKKLKDPQDIVSKTAKKLLIELQKCYPNHFETQILNQLKSDDEKALCRAIIKNDEEETHRLLNSGNQSLTKKTNTQVEEQKQSQTQQIQTHKGQQVPLNELSIVGKEILQSSLNSQNQQIHTVGKEGKAKDLDKIISEAKEESRYPKSQNGLFYGFLEEGMIEALNENNQYKERTNAIEAIESKLNIMLLSDKKVDFLPYATQFLGFIYQYIPDINFKISITSIKIISKLMQSNIINIKKHYQQLVIALIEKLADSKLVIRQSVLKCASYIIQNYKANQFASQAIKYFQNGNWHVREGSLQLIAQCIIQQNHSDTRSSQSLPQTPDNEGQLPLNPHLIKELSKQYLVEDKQKIQQMIIDIFALLISESADSTRTQALIQNSLGIIQVNNNDGNKYQREWIFYSYITERYNKGNFPFINEDGIIEFPSNLQLNKQPSINQRNEDQLPQKNNDTLANQYQKSLSYVFLEAKKKDEEEKKESYQRSYQNQQVKASQELNMFLGQNIQQEQQKISMWLPSFHQKQDDQQQIKSDNMNMRMSRDKSNNMYGDSYNKGQINADLFSNTQSSAATFIDDGKSNMTSTTMLSSNIKNDQSHQKFYHGNQNSIGKSPLTQVEDFQKSPLDSISSRQMYVNQQQNSANLYQNNSISQPQTSYNSNNMMQGRIGYTPESHHSKPRNIQTNDRQRSANQKDDRMYYGNESDKNKDGGMSLDLIGVDNQLQIHKNFSQSTSNPGAFGMKQQSQKGINVSDKLKLLKQNSNKNDPNNSIMEKSDSDQQYQIDQKQLNVPTFQKGYGAPIKATMATQEFLQTISTEEQQAYITPNAIKNKKPPLKTSQNANQNKLQNRAQSVDKTYQMQQEKPEYQEQSKSQDYYQVVDEPLTNPDLVFKQALDQLKSGDWSKQFEACNNIKRIAKFHKNLLTNQSSLYLPILKELLKLVDSLRSQLAKNAILTIDSIVQSIPTKEIDTNVDMLFPPLLKKAADTNVFIQESVDQALQSICNNCSDLKVLNSLQSQQNVKSIMLKVKIAMCYSVLIEKMGPRIRNFRDCDKLINNVCQFLNEGALEVRNMAKMALMHLKNALQGLSTREVEQFLMKCIKNDKTYEKARTILEKNDFESINPNGSTRYGSSMRGSSIDARSAGHIRGNATTQSSNTQQNDGFGQLTGSDFQMQSFMKGTVTSNTNFGGGGFNATSNTQGGKKRAVSKPVDPMIIEEFKQVVNEMSTKDWNKRLNAIDNMLNFVNTNQSIIKNAQPSKFIQLIDAFCMVIQDNNAKVLNQGQIAFQLILINENLKPLIELHISLIVQALNTNLSSTNATVREQGDQLFNVLESIIDPSQLIPPFLAQINLANNRSKHLLIDRLTYMIDKVEKFNLIQKYIGPLLQPNNKIQQEASSNARLKESLSRLQETYNSVQYV